MTVQDTFKNLVDQIKKGFEPEEEEYEPETIIPYETDKTLALAPDYKANTMKVTDSKLVVHPTFKGNTEAIVCEPRSYSESVEFVKYLKEKKIIILNLNLLEVTDATRLVDFLCGAVHALNGSQRKISDNVFIFTPMNVSLSAESQENKPVKDVLWN